MPHTFYLSGVEAANAAVNLLSLSRFRCLAAFLEERAHLQEWPREEHRARRRTRRRGKRLGKPLHQRRTSLGKKPPRCLVSQHLVETDPPTERSVHAQATRAAVVENKAGSKRCEHQARPSLLPPGDGKKHANHDPMPSAKPLVQQLKSWNISLPPATVVCTPRFVSDNCVCIHQPTSLEPPSPLPSPPLSKLFNRSQATEQAESSNIKGRG